MLAAWQRVFPHSYADPRIYLVDWAENVVQLQVALDSIKRDPWGLDLLVDSSGKNDLSGVCTVWAPLESDSDASGRTLDMGRPFLFGGVELRVGDFIGIYPHLVAPSRDDMATADAYFHNTRFWEHARRHMVFASYDDHDGSVPGSQR